MNPESRCDRLGRSESAHVNCTKRTLKVFVTLAGLISAFPGAEVTEGRQCRTITSALFLELGENQLIPNTRVLIEMLVFI